MLQIPMLCISMFHVVGIPKAFVSLEKQERVTAEAYRVCRSTIEMEAEAQLDMLQDVIYSGFRSGKRDKDCNDRELT